MSKLKGIVSSIKLRGEVSFVDLKGEVAHVDLRGKVHHVNLRLADLYLNPDTLDRLFSDSFSVAEVLAYTIEKFIVSEEVFFINEEHAIELSKPFADSFGVTESIHILRDLGFAFSDTATMSDTCLLYTSPSPRDVEESRMPSSA